MKQFKLHWLNGQEEIITGYNMADAVERAGYSVESLMTIDHFEEVEG